MAQAPDDHLSDACDDEQHDHASIVERARATMAADDDYADAANLFGAFADPNRLRILDAIRAADELCVSDIITITEMSQSAVSHALKLLRMRRLVASRRAGRHVYYRLDDEHVSQLVSFAMEHLAEDR